MDINHVVEALRSTTVADSQGQASDYLKEVSPVIGFPQLLLRLIHDEQLDCAVRQAAVIYFKNIICTHWELDDEQKRWTLSEQDKVSVKQQIIPAIIHSPEPIRVHLCTAIQNIMRNDFPARWTNFVDEILPLLRSSEAETLLGTLLILHRLCKIYEYKRQKEKAPLVELMDSALPLLHERLEILLPNQSQPSCILQKQILKIFFCLNQFTINLQILPMDQFTKWLHLLLAIVGREVPSECDTLPEDERAETVWWKCKKWALKIVQRVFERYGNKGNVDVSYNEFASQYSQNLVLPVINSLMVHVLNNFINGRFVSDEVLYFSLSHLSDAMNQAQAWQALKPHFEPLLKNVIFPLLQYSKEDEEMWDEDVEEFLRFKYDVYEDLHQPSSAASTLLQMLCKRQGVMQSLLVFIIEHLSPSSDVRQTDGALHMIAIVSSQLLKLKKYKKDVEKLLDAHVIPRTIHQNRFVRLRACYVLHYASETPFKNSKILERTIHSLIKCLKDDTDLPVRVQAAIAIQSLINDHAPKGTVLQIIRPHIGDLLINVLHLVKGTRVEDLPAVVDTLIEHFEEDVIPIAYDVTVQLVQTFHSMVVGQDEEDNEGGQLAEDYCVGVAGILSTLETILGLLEEHPDVVKRVEPVIRSCVSTIFDAYCETYFEEALSLTHSLILVHISPEMWTIYDQIHKTFLEEGTSFFSDCAPVLHAFLTNDTDNFFAVSDRVQHFLVMCEKTLTDDGEDGCDENTKAHAAKMLEVFVLQCQRRASHFIPDILRLVFNRLQKEPPNDFKLGQLKPQLLIVLIAALYSDFQMCSNLFGQMQLKADIGTFEWVVHELYANRKDFEGVHDRKMLIWLLCRILADGNLPTLFHNQPGKFMEWVLTLFEELQRCIKELAERSKDDDSDEDEEESSEEEDDRMNGELKDSDDDVDEDNAQYLMALDQQRSQRRSRRKSSTNKSMDDQTVGADDDILSLSSETADSEEHHHFEEETDLEAFSTSLDEQGDNKPGLNVFVLFKHTLEELSTRNSPLLASISDQQRIGQERVEKLKHLMEICTREENLERSKRVAQSGGYAFDASVPVPSTFSFS